MAVVTATMGAVDVALVEVQEATRAAKQETVILGGVRVEPTVV
jgi:hypothetical protein